MHEMYLVALLELVQSAWYVYTAHTGINTVQHQEINHL